MSDLSVPFNISLFIPTGEDFKSIRPIKTLDTFEGNTKQFHSDGLFSTDIFGKVGDSKRMERFSYIDFKLKVFHPIIYNTLGNLKRLYHEIITGKTYAVFDNNLKDFIKSNQLDGFTGFTFFEENWLKVQFKENESYRRSESIKLIEKFKKNCMCSLLVVMPAGLRDYEIDEHGQEQEEEINVLYRKMIAISNSISVKSFENAPHLYDNSRVNIQNTFNDIYNLIMNSIKGKKKLYMGKWATRSIHDTTRNVITTTNIVINNLGDKNNPTFNSIIVGLYQFAKNIAPLVRFRIKEFFSHYFNDSKLPVKVVDKESLQSKLKPINIREYDLWMSEEGLDKILNTFGIEEIRNKPITVSGDYIALIYDDGAMYKIFDDIRELQEGFDRKYVRPLRFSDLFYIILYKDASKFACVSTRYPITGFGSIFPGIPYLRSTIDATKRYELGGDWKPTGIVAPEFPGVGQFVNSFSPPANRLANAGADFDGDKMSLIVLQSTEADQEILNKLNSESLYVATNGKIAFSLNTDTVKFLMNNLIEDVAP